MAFSSVGFSYCYFEPQAIKPITVSSPLEFSDDTENQLQNTPQNSLLSIRSALSSIISLGMDALSRIRTLLGNTVRAIISHFQYIHSIRQAGSHANSSAVSEFSAPVHSAEIEESTHQTQKILSEPARSMETNSIDSPTAPATQTLFKDSDFEFYRKYGYYLIALTFVGGVIALALVQRFRDRELAKFAAKHAHQAAGAGQGGGVAAHVRRASAGGPLQVSAAHARVVREALDVVASDPRLAELLGRPIREGRLLTSKASRGDDAAARLAGTFSVAGPKGSAVASILAAKAGEDWRVTSLSVQLAGSPTPIEVFVASAGPTGPSATSASPAKAV